MSFEPVTDIGNFPIVVNGGGGGGGSGNITIGTTVIPVGGTTLILEGLNSVTSALFIGNLLGSASSTNSLVLSNNTANQQQYITFSNTASGQSSILTNSSLRFNPSTGTLSATIFSGSGSLLTGIPNSALASSSITIGTTTISLGDTTLTLSGLTSVSSTTFIGNLTGTADKADTIKASLWSVNQTYKVPFMDITNPYVNLLYDNLLFSPQTGTLTSLIFSGSGSQLTNIPNSALDNNSITIGTVTIPLGDTVTNITGLVSVTSTTFIGNLTGTADLATNVSLSSGTNNANHYLTFSANPTGSNPLLTGGVLYNPSTGVLTAGTFSGNLTGTASNVTVTGTATNLSYSMVFASASSGSVQLLTDTTGFSYNPSTNILTATTFSGNLTGTATNATNVNVISTTTNATYFVNFTSASAGNTPVRAFTGFTFNPSTQVLSVANITATTGYNITNTVTAGAYNLLYSSANTGFNLIRAGGTLTFDPSTNVLTTGTFSGSGASLTNIPNTALVNSQITIGTTAISLGQTVSTLAGLTSVTSTTFVGNLTGTASLASQISITNNTTNASFLIPFVTGIGNQSLYTNTLSYNPSTNVLTVTTFSGSGALLTNIPNSALVNSQITIGTTPIVLGDTTLSLSGLTSVTSTTFVGSLTGNASSATQINLTDTVLNNLYGLVFTDASVGGNSTIYRSSANNITFNPSTGFLSATRFVGSGAGLTNIPNTALTNSSITIGTTNISLGATTLTLAGLTSVTSTNFVGNLTGTASSASQVVLSAIGSNLSYNVLFSSGATGSSTVFTSINNNIIFNPSTGVLTVTQFSGSGAGLTNIPNTALTNSSITIGTTNISLGATTLTLAGLTSVSAGTFTGSGAGLTNIPNTALTNSSITIGTTNISLGATTLTLAGLTSVSAGTFTGSGAGLSNIPNAALTNSTITLGTSTVALGATLTNISGLGTVTATTFVGNLTGTATNAQNLAVSLSTTNASFYLTFVPNATTSTQAFSINSAISVNPSTGALTAISFIGSGAGLTNIPNTALTNSSITIGTTNISLGATTLTLAGLTSVSAGTFNGSGAGLTNIPNSALTNNSITLGTSTVSLGGTLTNISGLGTVTATTFVGAFSGTVTNAQNLLTTLSSTNASFYLTFVANATTSTQAFFVNSSVSFNPSTGTLSATSFSGSGAGLTNIPNTALTNNSITLGTSTVALGGTLVNISGLGLLSFSPVTNQNIITAGLSTDVQPKFLININNGIQYGDGTNPVDLRIYRSGTKTLTIDDNAGGSATLQVTGPLISGSIQTGAISCGVITSGTAATLNLPGSLLTLTPASAQAILIGRLSTDTQPRTQLGIDSGLLFGDGSVTPDIRFFRSGTNLVAIDGGAGVPATLIMNSAGNIGSSGAGGSISGFQTITRAGSLSINTSASNGSITYTTNGSGNHIFNSTTGNMQINIPITNASGNLVLNPTSGVSFSNKNIVNLNAIDIPTSASTNYDAILFSAGTVNTGSGSGPRINLGTSFSNSGDDPGSAKLLIAGSAGFGFGGQALNHYVQSTYSHRFYCANAAGTTPVFSISASGITIRNGVNLTNTSGDLVISPVGSLNLDGKNIINVGSVTATTFNGTATSATSITINTPIPSADTTYLSTLVNTTGTGVSVYTPNNLSSYQYNPLLSRNYIGSNLFPQANYFQNTTVNRLNFTNLPNLVRTNQPTTGMQAIACSGDGRVIAVANATQILVSTNYGSTFGTPIAISGITTIAMCNSGQYIVTNNTDNTNISIRISTDYGATFNQVIVAAVTNTPVTCVSISGNCKYIIVNTATTTQYLSTNFGTSFVTKTGFTAINTNSTISADGRYMVIINSDIFSSEDYGTTFTQPFLAVPIGANVPAISDDFKYLFCPGTSVYIVNSNYGVGTPTTVSNGGTGNPAMMRCSTDGRIVIHYLGATLNITRYSQDFGQTFSNFSTSNMTGLAMTKNGQFFYLIDSGNLYQYGNALVTANYGSMDVNGVLSIRGDSLINGTLVANGNSIFNSDLQTSGNLIIQKTLNTNTIDTFNNTTTQLFRANGSNIFSTNSTNGLTVFSGITNASSALFISNNTSPTTGTGTIAIQSLLSPTGYMSIGFNGMFNAGEVRFNTAKTRWRINVSQAGASDIFTIDNFNGSQILNVIAVTRPTTNRVLADYPTTYNTNFYAAPRGYNDVMTAAINQNAIGNTATFVASGVSTGNFSIPANLFTEAVGRGFELFCAISSNFAASTSVALQLFTNLDTDGVVSLYTFGAANSVFNFRARFIVIAIAGNTVTYRYLSNAVSATTSRLSANTGTFNPTTALNVATTIGLRLRNNTVVAATSTVTINAATLTIF